MLHKRTSVSPASPSSGYAKSSTWLWLARLFCGYGMNCCVPGSVSKRSRMEEIKVPVEGTTEVTVASSQPREVHDDALRNNEAATVERGQHHKGLLRRLAGKMRSKGDRKPNPDESLGNRKRTYSEGFPAVTESSNSDVLDSRSAVSRSDSRNNHRRPEPVPLHDADGSHTIHVDASHVPKLRKKGSSSSSSSIQDVGIRAPSPPLSPEGSKNLKLPLRGKLRVLRRKMKDRDPSLRRRLKQVMKYHLKHPVEQVLVFFPLACVAGMLVKWLILLIDLVPLQMGIAVGSTGLFSYSVCLLAIWLVQEQFTVQSFDLQDPRLAGSADDEQEATGIEEQPEEAQAQHQEESFEEHLSDIGESVKHPEAKLLPPEPSQHPSQQNSESEFWSFSKYIQSPGSPRKFPKEKEDLVSFILNKYFDNSKEIWSRSQYLCINDDPRSGAVRALEARQWNPKEACKLIEMNLRWRDEYQVDEVFSQLISEANMHTIRSALGDGFYGLDKTGHPLWFCPAGKVNLNTLKADLGDLNILLLYHVQCLEFNQQVWFSELSKHQNNSVYQMTIVLDLSGFGLHTVRGAFWECLDLIGNVDRDFYYENVHRVYIINAPAFFRFFWRTLSPVFDPDTRVKFRLLSHPRDLVEFIDPRLIPVDFGGKSRKSILYRPDKGYNVYSQHVDAFLKDWRLRRNIEQSSSAKDTAHSWVKHGNDQQGHVVSPG